MNADMVHISQKQERCQKFDNHHQKRVTRYLYNLSLLYLLSECDPPMLPELEESSVVSTSALFAAERSSLSSKTQQIYEIPYI